MEDLIPLLSLAGLLCFGFCADPGLVDHLQAMADGVEEEAQEPRSPGR